MRRIQSPLDRTPQQSIDNRVSSQPQEEPQKKESLGLPNEASKHLSLSILGSIAHFLGKQLEALSIGKRKKADTKEKRKILENLAAFKKLLSTITELDQSYNPEFIQKMSELWNEVITDYYFIKSLDEATFVRLEKLEMLIKKFNTFPENEEHSLGYYLKEYVGEKWLPFPFIQCMQLLYEDHQQRPVHSHLQEFLSLLQEIISSPEVK